jgi:DNA modification methylase
MCADINYALVEETRPPIYTAMKYWGKKPHNIWKTYIDNYTPENGIYLDPFCGSGLSAFEAFKAKRKVIAFDLNPLTSFIIEVFATNFDNDLFVAELERIMQIVENDSVYLKYFTTKSRKSENDVIVQSFKWDKGVIYELGIEMSADEIAHEKNKKNRVKKKIEKRYKAKPIDIDFIKANDMGKIKIPYWTPDTPFHNSPSFPASFISAIGGNKFSNLWTRRNLYVISKIFDEILKIKNIDLQKQLLFGFIQTIHLCTKMSIPRRDTANRAFSTSWGRSAYLCSARQMEMNPLLVFKGSCIGRQSVQSCLLEISSYLGGVPKILNVGYSDKQKNKLTGFDIKYGAVDINTLLDFIPEESVDFILTDPPYGGLVQYLDLSTIWLIWLEHYNQKYKPNYSAEITVKPGLIPLSLYQQRFTNGIKNLYKIIKPGGKVVFTFHNKNLSIWNAFLKSITLAGFKIEKVIHQQNRRTGESNVANPYGTSATDFYIRCIKSNIEPLKNDKDEFEHFVLTKAIEIIARRNEPTPFQFLFNGLLTEISSGGFDLEDFDANIQQILEKHKNTVFKITNNLDNKSGMLWWFVEPKEFIKYPDRLLTDRVEDTILSYLRRKTAVTFDEILAEIFVKYPNGLTPDIKSIDKILKRIATQSGGKWLYKGQEIEMEFTRHTEILYILSEVGHKMGYKVFIGKREQPEPYKNGKLTDYADFKTLSHLKFDKEKLSRIEMIDMIWLNGDTIEYVIEVENSTKFTSGVQRASNLDSSIPKIMILPDYRKKEFLSTNDPLFKDSFKSFSWTYALYSDIEKIVKTKKLTNSVLNTFLNKLK